jgi:hypothetical protein
MPLSAWAERRLPSKANGLVTALAGGDEHHVGALEDLLQLLGVVLGGLAADVGVRAGAEAAGQLPPHVQLDVGVGGEQGLGVGVHGDELDAFEARLDHAVDGVDSTAADPDHLDHGQVVLRRRHHPTILLRPFHGQSSPSRGPGKRGKLSLKLRFNFMSTSSCRGWYKVPLTWSTTLV